MKILCCLILCLVLVGCDSEGKSSQFSEAEMERFNIIKQKISSVTLTAYHTYKTGEMETNGSLISFAQYDSLGNVIEKFFAEDDDTTHFTRSYVYDGEANILSMRDYDSIGMEEVLTIFKYQGIHNNKVSELALSGKGDTLSKIIFKYDDRENKIEEFHIFNLLHKPTEYHRFLYYDVNQDLVRKEVEPAQENRYVTDVYEYSKVGNLKRKTSFNRKGIKTNIISYSYDQNGNISESREISGSKIVASKNTYDENNNEIETINTKTFGEDSKPISDKYRYSYENGVKMYERYYNSKDELLITYKYQYTFFDR